MQDSEVCLHPGGGVTFAGPDAVNLYRAMTLKAALSLYVKTKIVPTRGVTGPDMLRMATEYTGHKYKRGAYEEAAKDVADWVQTMKAAMPVTQE